MTELGLASTNPVHFVSACNFIAAVGGGTGFFFLLAVFWSSVTTDTASKENG